MEISGTNNAESTRINTVRTDQQRVDNARVEDRPKEAQKNREVSEAPAPTTDGRGNNVNLTI